MKRVFLAFLMVFSILNALFCQTWQPSGLNLYLNPSTSNLGVGTSFPNYKLHVDNGTLKIGNGSDVTSRAANLLSIGDGNYIQIGEWEADNKLSFKASSYNFTSGNIGIGSLTPSAKLHIDSPTGLMGLYINHQATVDNSWGMKINVNRDLTKAFILANSTSGKDVVLIYGNGQVFGGGFNTTTGGGFSALNIGQYAYGFSVGAIDDFAKAYSLTDKNKKEVFYVWGNGVVNAKKIYAEAFEVHPDALKINWFDYVFSSSYSLRSLNEVEMYVKENNHLPDMPSEKDVKENGFNMAEMDGLLLKKIEELTLYVIQQQKEIEELKQKVKDSK